MEMTALLAFKRNPLPAVSLPTERQRNVVDIIDAAVEDYTPSFLYQGCSLLDWPSYPQQRVFDHPAPSQNAPTHLLVHHRRLFVSAVHDATESFYRQIWNISTSAACPPTPALLASATDLDAARRVERLMALQTVLGFSMQALADVLSISRAQLYKWMDRRNDISLQDASRKRLEAIEMLASHWRTLSKRPLDKAAKEPLAGGGTLLGMMSAIDLNVPQIKWEMTQRAGELTAAGRSESQRLSDAGYKRRPSHRSLPSDE